MTDYIPAIAKVNKADRFQAIADVLRNNGIPYRVRKIPGYSTSGNILVEFNPESQEKKTVVSAHYDNCAGTPGANDNAAACSILLNLILDARVTGTEKHLEFAFFDLEECGFLGSKQYLAENRDLLLGAFNLDMCGMGSHIVAALYNGAEKVYPHTISGDAHLVRTLPPGDAYTFRGARLPTVYVVNSTDGDLSWYDDFAAYGNPTRMDPDFLSTMHQPNDTPETCNPAQVEKIFEYVRGCIK